MASETTSLSIARAAKFLNVSRSRVNQFVASGQLTKSGPPGRQTIPLVELRELLDARTAEAAGDESEASATRFERELRVQREKELADWERRQALDLEEAVFDERKRATREREQLERDALHEMKKHTKVLERVAKSLDSLQLVLGGALAAALVPNEKKAEAWANLFGESQPRKQAESPEPVRERLGELSALVARGSGEPLRAVPKDEHPGPPLPTAEEVKDPANWEKVFSTWREILEARSRGKQGVTS
ncbi:MAG TPA: hypothetical protein VFQ35_04645 [Polyangiaceae bacterium]|nr:hypothetical protein [Polyangiaceae bacterium]